MSFSSSTSSEEGSSREAKRKTSQQTVNPEKHVKLKRRDEDPLSYEKRTYVVHPRRKTKKKGEDLETQAAERWNYIPPSPRDIPDSQLYVSWLDRPVRLAYSTKPGCAPVQEKKPRIWVELDHCEEYKFSETDQRPTRRKIARPKTTFLPELGSRSQDVLRDPRTATYPSRLMRRSALASKSGMVKSAATHKPAPWNPSADKQCDQMTPKFSRLFVSPGSAMPGGIRVREAWTGEKQSKPGSRLTIHDVIKSPGKPKDTRQRLISGPKPIDVRSWRKKDDQIPVLERKDADHFWKFEEFVNGKRNPYRGKSHKMKYIFRPGSPRAPPLLHVDYTNATGLYGEGFESWPAGEKKLFAPVSAWEKMPVTPESFQVRGKSPRSPSV